jgi:uncharacterized Zn finger protein
MAKKESRIDRFRELTWDDLMGWAGSTIVSRGENYQRNRQVQGLARTPRGGLVAWVRGTERYATRVEFKGEEMVADCTCPYGGTCKHAVAVVLEYLNAAKKNTQVPTVSDQDERMMLLKEAVDSEDWDRDWQEEEIEEGKWDKNEDEEEERFESHRPTRPKKAISPSLSGFLQKQTKEQLATLLRDLVERFPDVREALQDQVDLSKGSIRNLASAIRKEVYELSSKPGWRNNWNGEGYIPDYSRVRERLKILLGSGHADEVVSLGKEILKAGKEQVEMSHDEGETGEEISSCLDIVFQALTQSSLPPIEQMLWAVDASLEDEYDLCRGMELFWEQKYDPSDWSLLADKLLERLNLLPSRKREDKFSFSYRRDNISNWLIQALENAGRKEEIIPLCEREAEITESYPRLVKCLMDAGRFQEAEEWIKKGIKATQQKLPGIARGLRSAFREMREKEGDWLRVSSFRAEEFFQEPTLHTFQELEKAAKRAKVWPEVRAAALNYLETGKLPKGEPSWPLPETGLSRADGRRPTHFPAIETLIDIAIAEKRPDDVIRWYDRRKPQRVYGDWFESMDDRIAEAVVDTYPERAVAIWKRLAENQIALTKPKAYEGAAVFLRKAHQLLKKQGKEKEWENYINDLRRVNKAKRRFVEILDHLGGRRIIEG